ncbi:V-set domain containing T-cell activation inhibitor 1 [Tachysurus fulvidraco]|uniref:V-set domain containing T-cell activation inhibitor 1 n=1 Tax=Tachysurus fulvidraco TaxID=1234273 RepID=UPI001FEE6C27|nr:V-set domain containing T-cell activation inhibitor 1 [Tachysurus fulvidraco]
MQQTSRTFLLFWTILLSTRAAGDDTVTCVWSSSCVLPCRSQYHDIIHWYKDGKPNAVHTFFDKADHLEYQDGHFKNRTSLFRDQLSQGNISLLLQSIRSTDEGRYKCYTATSTENNEKFIKLIVQAKEMDLNIKNEKLSCGMKDVYPKPQISWERDGSPEKNFTLEGPDVKEGLFSVSSVLTQSVKENITYTCTISLGYENQTASLRRENVDIMSGQNATIHCPVSQEISGNSNITLMFGSSSTNLPYSQVSKFPMEKEWGGKKIRVALDGTVTIHNVENEHTGVYRCVRVSALSRQEVLSNVQITSENNHTAVAVGVVVLLLFIIIIIIFIAVKFCRHRRNNTTRNNQRSSSSGNNRNSSDGNQEAREKESLTQA